MDNEAIKFIKDSIPKDQIVYLGFSGGKDSLVSENILKRSGIPYQSFYTFTTNDPPEIVRFIRKHYPDTKILRPNKNFWYQITTNNPPLPQYRWCCRELKKRPGWKIPLIHRVMGIRKEESTKRSKYKRINHFDSKKYGRIDHFQYYPIFNWNEADIWDYIESEKLPFPDLYEKGLHRIGCIVCPYHSFREHEIYRNLWPQNFKLFEKSVSAWFYKRLAQGRTLAYKTPQDFLHDWYRNKAIWYRKIDAQKQMSLF